MVRGQHHFLANDLPDLLVPLLRPGKPVGNCSEKAIPVPPRSVGHVGDVLLLRQLVMVDPRRCVASRPVDAEVIAGKGARLRIQWPPVKWFRDGGILWLGR